MLDRDSRTLGTVTEDELAKIQKAAVAIVGAGGLGGYVIEMLARMGVGSITIIDSDTIDATNLNRQLLTNEANLHKVKANEAVIRVRAVNSRIKAKAVRKRLNERNADQLLNGHDIVFDCTDNIATRFILQEACERLQVPFIHGAVDRWCGQTTIVFPGDRTLNSIYRERQGIPNAGVASFIPPLIASYQVAEFVKWISSKGDSLRHKLLYLDMLSNRQFVVDLTEKK